MKQAIQARFSDSHKAHQAVQEILARGGRDLDISTVFEGTYAVATASRSASSVLRGAAAAAVGLLSAFSPQLQMARQSAGVSPLASLGSVVAAGLMARFAANSAATEEPAETYEEGAAEISVLCPSGSLSSADVQVILRRHGAR